MYAQAFKGNSIPVHNGLFNIIIPRKKHLIGIMKMISGFPKLSYWIPIHKSGYMYHISQ